MSMFEGNQPQPNVGEVRKLMQMGNRYAANKEWGSAMSMFRGALDLLYAPYFKTPDPGTDIPVSGSAAPPPLPDEQPGTVIQPVQSVEDPQLRQHFHKSADAPMLTYQFKRGLPGTEEVIWHVVFPSTAKVQSDRSWPQGDSTSYVFIRMHGAPVQLNDAVASLTAYGSAHLADATAAKLDEMYRQYQILDGAAIPAMLQVAQMYELALFLKPDDPWTLAHCGELHRNLANCLLDNNGHLQSKKQRIDSYVKSIVFFRRAIDVYRDRNALGEPLKQYTWACAHLGAAVVNARAFVGLKKDVETDRLDQLLQNWPESWPELPATPMAQRQAGLTEVVQFLNRAMKLFVLALKSQGFYYPWAHSYYSASLLLKGALDDQMDATVATQVAGLGQVISSQAYYLDPRLLEGVFEPVQLGVNPPFELAIVYFSKALRHDNKLEIAMDCRKAWSYAWIGMKWLFKYRFQEGLQGLTICALLAKIAILYKDVPAERRTESATEHPGLIESAMLSEGSDSANMAQPFKVPMAPIDNPAELVAFINDAIRYFASWQVRLFLEEDVKLNSNILTGLILTYNLIRGFVSHLTDDLKKGTADVIPLERLLKKIHDKMQNLLPPPYVNLAFSSSPRQQTGLDFIFSIITYDTISIGQIKTIPVLMNY